MGDLLDIHAPSVEAMNTMRQLERSTTAPRYSSLSMSVQDSTRILLTGWPLASVW